MSPSLTRKALLAGAAAAAVDSAVTRSAAAAPRARLRAVLVDGDVPLEEPASALWKKARPITVPVLPQQMTPPFLTKPTVSSLRVRALANRRSLGFLLEWEDGEADVEDGLYRFHDAVAVMLPRKAGGTPPPFTMGAPGHEVQILQWRASWQHDIERRGGYVARVAELYPNVVRDVPPQKVLPSRVAELWSPADAVGNPLAAEHPTSAVNEIVAAGFGSTTTVAKPSAHGRGMHDGSGWRVALGLPTGRGGIGDSLKPGSVWNVAFAVWRGDAQNRGRRKHWAEWVTCGLPGRS